MPISPHQNQRLQDKITALKAELEEKTKARSQILTLGQSYAGGGMSTTYPSYAALNEEIKFLEAQIEVLTAALNGECAHQPGVNFTQYRSDYA